MSGPLAPPPETQGAPKRTVAWMPPNSSTTPNAERYLLEADALRRRQLRSALLHGSSRTWREHRRIWPAIVAGVVVVAVLLAAFAVVKAFRASQEEQEQLGQQSVEFSPEALGRAVIV